MRDRIELAICLTVFTLLMAVTHGIGFVVDQIKIEWRKRRG